MASSVVARWHEIVRSRDGAALDALLAEEVVFHSPVVFRPQVGKPLTKAYLTAALEVLGNETFRYGGQWDGANSAVLEFVATIDGVEIDGADFIAWNDDDRIASFKVMVRPLKAIEMVRAKMAAQLARAQEA
jgi:hypothetical protein